MATTRPRHMVTVTDDIAQALIAAARRWPAQRDRPGELLRRLITEGHRALRAAEANRRQAVLETSGIATGVFGAGYLAELREDWPE